MAYQHHFINSDKNNGLTAIFTVLSLFFLPFIIIFYILFSLALIPFFIIFLINPLDYYRGTFMLFE